MPQTRQGRPVAAVDVVRVLPRAPRRRARSAGRVVTIRPLRTPARIRVTRSAQRRPPARRRRPVPGRNGVMPVAEQDLGPVDVADTGEHGLVHEQRADGGATGAMRRRRARRRRHRVAAGRGPAGEDGVDLRVGQHLAGGRAAQVGPCDRQRRASAAPAASAARRAAEAVHRSRRRTCRRGRGGRGRQSTLEALEQVLAVGGDPFTRRPSSSAAPVGEPALRTGDGDDSVPECGVLLVRQPVQRMAFRHLATLARCPRVDGRRVRSPAPAAGR